MPPTNWIRQTKHIAALSESSLKCICWDWSHQTKHMDAISDSLLKGICWKCIWHIAGWMKVLWNTLLKYTRWILHIACWRHLLKLDLANKAQAGQWGLENVLSSFEEEDKLSFEGIVSQRWIFVFTLMVVYLHWWTNRAKLNLDFMSTLTLKV